MTTTDSVTSIVVTASVKPRPLGQAPSDKEFLVFPLAPLLAEAISRIHAGGSLSELLHLND